MPPKPKGKKPKAKAAKPQTQEEKIAEVEARLGRPLNATERLDFADGKLDGKYFDKEIGAPKEGAAKAAEDHALAPAKPSDHGSDPAPIAHPVVPSATVMNVVKNHPLTSVRVTVHRGQVKDMDRFGKSDPYVVVSVDGHKQQTPVIKGNCNPEWNHTMELPITSASPVLHLEAFDQDIGKDDQLGTGSFDLLKLKKDADGIIQNERIPLELHGQSSGWVEISLVAGWKADEVTHASGAAARNYQSILLTVVSGKDMKTGDVIGKADPYVIVRTLPGGHNDKFQTSTKPNSTNPVWEESHEFDIRGESDFKIEVMDKDTITADDLIGETQVSFKELSLQNGPGEALLPIFKSGKTSGQVLLRWVPKEVGHHPPGAPIGYPGAPIAYPGAPIAYPGATVGYPGAHHSPPHSPARSGLPPPPPLPPHSGTEELIALNVTVKEGRDLPNEEGFGKSLGKIDPYVRIATSNYHWSTAAQKNTFNPVWEEGHTFNMIGEPQLKFEVMDKDRIGHDDFIAEAVVLVSDLPLYNGPLYKWIPLYRKQGQQQGELYVGFQPKFGPSHGHVHVEPAYRPPPMSPRMDYRPPPAPEPPRPEPTDPVLLAKRQQIEALRVQLYEERLRHEALRRGSTEETHRLQMQLEDEREQLRRTMAQIRAQVAHREPMNGGSPMRVPSYNNGMSYAGGAVPYSGDYASYLDHFERYRGPLDAGPPTYHQAQLPPHFGSASQLPPRYGSPSLAPYYEPLGFQDPLIDPMLLRKMDPRVATPTYGALPSASHLPHEAYTGGGNADHFPGYSAPVFYAS